MNSQTLPKIDYMLFCDSVSTAPDGKKTAYGIFDRINAKKFPATHPSFSTILSLVEGQGKFKISIRIFDPKDIVAFKANDAVEIEFTEKLKRAEIVLQFQGFNLKEPGKYYMQILANGEQVENGIKNFEVRLAP